MEPTDARAFRELVRSSAMSFLVGPIGLADRVASTLRAAGEALIVYRIDDLYAHERGRELVRGWQQAAAAPRQPAPRLVFGMTVEPVAKWLEPREPSLAVFDLRGRILLPDVSRSLYYADLAARAGVMQWIAVMTHTARWSLDEGERYQRWPSWTTRARDLGEQPETAVLLAPLGAAPC